MEKIRFDFNNMLSSSIGRKDGVSDAELSAFVKKNKKAALHLETIISHEGNRVNLGLQWAALPFQNKEDIRKIQALGREIAANYKNVLFLGIGGSYLGLKAAQDALAPAYFNDFKTQRKDIPRIYFDGNNLDPEPLRALLNNLLPRETFVVVISKSGETTETKAAFAVTEAWLKKGIGRHYGRQIVAITDPASGTLRKKVIQENSADSLSFRSLSLLKGVGGRFSEFNMGLLHLAVLGINLQEILEGARDMAARSSLGNPLKNPAYMYAALQTIAYKKKGKVISILMPFAQSLKSTADWYSQLLAESLGKKFSRGGKIVNTGRTPVAACGTGDLHSIQQNNIEGENNKTVTFIRVEKFRNDILVPQGNGILSGMPYSKLMGLALEATEWSLVRESRPNCTIILPRISPYSWGALIFFFEMATAFEGEFLNVNAFDQPGVEGYKNYMYFKLRKPGLPEAIADQIRRNPLLKKQRFII